jgi:diguanylate cyclase (GGDEF)-like protein
VEVFDDAFRIDRLTAEFVYPETEWGFREYIKDSRIRDTRMAIFISALFYLFFAVTDFLGMQGSPDYLIVLLTRLGICAVGVTAAFIAQRSWQQLVNGTIPSLVSGSGMAAFIAITFLRPYSIGWHGMSMMAMLLGVYVFIPNRFLAVIMIGITASLAFLTLAVIQLDLQVNELARLTTLLAVTNILGAMTNYRLSRLMREEYRDHAIVTNANRRLKVEMEERARLEDVLRRRAEVDEVTGTANRTSLFEQAAELLNQANAEAKPLSLLQIDVDYFRQFHATYGHLRSDEVLKSLVSVAETLLSGDQYLARLGGEEFIVLLPGTGQTEAARMAERIRAECQRTPVAMDDVTVHFTISIGVVQYRPGESLDVLFRRADEAKAVAKYKGRNRVEAAN